MGSKVDFDSTDYRLKVMGKLFANTTLTKNGCVEWGGVNIRGYGRINYKGKPVLTHRLSWMFANNKFDITPNDYVCHHCDNPPCINPEHLWLGTHQENMQDASSKGRLYGHNITHCPQGHEYSGDNLYVNKLGSNVCKTCSNTANRAYRKRLKAKQQLQDKKQ